MSILNLRTFYAIPLVLITTVACTLSCSTAQKAPENSYSINKDTPIDWPIPQSPFNPEQSLRIQAQANAILATMTLTQKVGQMTQAEIGSITPAQVQEFQLGSVLVGGGAFLNNNKNASAKDWLASMDQYHSAATQKTNNNLGVPLLWGVDAVHGHNKIFGATLFPHNIGLGATKNPELVKTISAITAKQVLVTGLNWTFSPSVSVVRDDRWGRTYESYSEHPSTVANLGAASIEGYQGAADLTNLIANQHIVATAKHFIGDGGTDGGVDRGDTKISEAELAALHAPGYKSAIEAGVLTIMASHNSWEGTRLHGHKHLLNDILKQKMGFEGFIIGDWNSHALVDNCSNDHCPGAINAGIDMLMVPNDWQAFITNTVKDVEEGRITTARIDDAVRRILSVKIRAGLFGAPKPSARNLAGDTSWLHGPKVRQVARQAVRESAVLLKNNNHVLPIQPGQTILIAGAGADNIPMQNGGWTISWQSTDTTNADFPNATSVYQGIKKQVESSGGKVILNTDGKYPKNSTPDVAIVIYGEPPYAEWQGDLPHLAYQTQAPENAKILERLQKHGIKTVSVFLSGRPLWVNRELNASDAFVAAWLPGTEGDGIAQLLLRGADGKRQYNFSGSLPFSWPNTPTQTPLNFNEENYAPLFPIGYGLRYEDTHVVAQLPAEFSLEELNNNANEPLFEGVAVSPWEVHLTTPKSTPVRYLSGLAQNGALTVIEADKGTQGDSIGARWDGTSEATVALYNPGAFKDLSVLAEQSSALVFDARLLKPSTMPIYFSMVCRGDGCSKDVEMTTLVNTSPVNDWNSLSVSLKCFDKDGFNLSEVRQAFGVKTQGALQLDIANIRIEPNMSDKAGVTCQ